MEQPNSHRVKGSDEVDLTQFFRWIGRGVSRFGRSSISGLASLRLIFFQNRLFFAGIIILGLILGALYASLLKKDYYKTSMVLSCAYLNTQIVENTISKFNQLCKEDVRKGLAEELKIDSATAQNIQEFAFKPFVSEDDIVEMEVLRTQLSAVAADKKDLVEKVINKLEIENKDAYEISVFVYNPDIVKEFEKALVNYFRESDYVKRRIDINKENLLRKRQKLQSEMRKLDSLKTVLFKNYEDLGKTSRGTGNVYLGDEKLANPIDVFREDLSIYKELESVERQLYIQSDFEVVDGFTTFNQPESDSLAKTLFISFWISIFMGFLIIGAWRFDRLLANYSSKPDA